jgi:glycolate oxidase iron-sulfur subunit
MHVRLTDSLRDTPDGAEAAAILGRCVHCGFCTATCPTYRVLGDELDGPRGRIYLVKRVLEGAPATRRTQLHLDRCLTCRACETTCPSGVEYGRLADIGRRVVDGQVARPLPARALRALLRGALTRPRLFGALLGTARALRPLLPRSLREKVLPRGPALAWPATGRRRRAVLLAGCVQPALLPGIGPATARVLDALGIECVVPASAGCCGALRQHLGAPDAALADVRRNVDAWWPLVDAGAEAIVTDASGCGAMVEEYGHLLRGDPAYAARAARISALACDVVELVADRVGELAARLPAVAGPPPRIAFHPPCTLQHAQRVRGSVERVLAALGATLVSFPDVHQCCGSAGTYSLTQPALATELRARKLAALEGAAPDLVLSANVGCIAHLGAASGVPVRHWVEWVAERLAANA